MPEQAQHDYLAGNYPVVREDAAQMCALQMQAEGGPTMVDGPDALEIAIERFVHKQVRTRCACLPSCLIVHDQTQLCYVSRAPSNENSCHCTHLLAVQHCSRMQQVDRVLSVQACRCDRRWGTYHGLAEAGERYEQVLMTRPREEWRHDVLGRYKALEQFSKEDARLQFLRILRSLPYGVPCHPACCAGCRANTNLWVLSLYVPWWDQRAHGCWSKATPQSPKCALQATPSSFQ